MDNGNQNQNGNGNANQNQNGNGNTNQNGNGNTNQNQNQNQNGNGNGNANGNTDQNQNQNGNTNGNTNQNGNTNGNTNQQQDAAQSSSSSVNIPQTAPAGGLTITQPPQTATSYYKIAPSNTITFAWNFTDVLSMPTHLTVSAVCDNGNTYPVGPTDGVIAGDATSVTWDLWAYQTAHSNLPLAEATYVLHIWDDRGPGAAREPGLLSENSALKFALYSPQAYTPLESWTCTTCNGAVSDYVAHPAFISLTITFVIMFLSGYSLIRQALR